jgi:hypothetical protein
LQGLETGQREGIRVRPQAMLEAKDLPHNNLSMLLEQRVNRKLEEDRQARAAQQVRGRADSAGVRVTAVSMIAQICLATCDAIGSDCADSLGNM